MPVALNADRGLIQALVAQGFTAAEISRKTGVKSQTIGTWTKRYGWRNTAAKVTQILTETKTPALAVKVAQASSRVRQRLADDIEAQADGLVRRKHGRTIKEALSRAELARRLADASNKVFQWDQQSQSGLVSVETLLDLEARPALPGSAQPAIDVQSTADPQSLVSQDANNPEPDVSI